MANKTSRAQLTQSHQRSPNRVTSIFTRSFIFLYIVMLPSISNHRNAIVTAYMISLSQPHGYILDNVPFWIGFVNIMKIQPLSFPVVVIQCHMNKFFEVFILQFTKWPQPIDSHWYMPWFFCYLILFFFIMNLFHATSFDGS